jgi:tetratricopeptide (TPR) repeat protein
MGSAFVSRLISRIEEQLLNETDPYVRAELEAKRASYLARVGRFLESGEAIANVRRAFGDGRSGRVTALVMIAEGLLIHYEKLGSGATDRVTRSQLLGHAMKDREVVALASAWRGYLEFEDSKFDAAFRSIKQAFDNARPEDHAVWTRCAIVMSLGFALCGQLSDSQHWFMEGREHALQDGDQASIDALLHNKAAFGVAWLWAQKCKGSVDESALRRARMELASARSLQGLADVRAHSAYVDLSEARLSLLEGQYETALADLEAIASAGPFPARHFNESVLALEVAYCHASLGRVDMAIEALSKVDDDAIAALDVDDRLVAAWIAAELSQIDERIGERSQRADVLASTIEEHDLAIGQLASQLQPYRRT